MQTIPGRFGGCTGFLFALLCAAAPTSALAITPPGIVFEAEDIAEPREAWKKDARAADRWTLWTQESEIERKRSKGAVMCSPVVAAERDSAEEGAPPLHCVVTNLPPGTYGVHISPPGRPLAYSSDGRSWTRYQGGELHLGARECPSGRFEFWIDDRHAHPPGNPGPGYFDYVRFVPVPAGAMAFDRSAPWFGIDATVAETGGWLVPAQACRLEGFEPEGRDTIKAGGPPAKFLHTFEKAGRFYLAVQMVDDKDGVEHLAVSLNGREIGVIVGDGDTDGPQLFRLKDRIAVKAGDTLTLAAATPVGMYRVDRLILSPEPIVAPRPRFENFDSRSAAPGAATLYWTASRAIAGVELSFASGNTNQQTVAIPGGPARNFRAPLSGLDPAREYRARISADADGARIESAEFRFRAAPPSPEKTTASQTIPLEVADPAGRPGMRAPAIAGIPFVRGALARAGDLRLFDATGAPVALQVEPFAHWPDGSVKIAVVSFFADTKADAAARYRLEARPAWDGAAPATAPAVEVREDADAWRVCGSGLHFDLGKKVPALFANIGFDRDGDGKVAPSERIAAAPRLANLRLETADGTNLTCGPPGRFAVECNGPVRAVLRWSGPLVDADGRPGWAYIIRATLYAGLPEMRLSVTVINDNPEPKFREVKMLALRLPLEGAGGVRGGFDGAARETPPDDEGLWLLQDRDDHAILRGASGTREAQRSQGLAVASDAKTVAAVAMRDFWQAFPSGFAVKPDGLHIRLLPPLAPDAYKDASALDSLKLYGWCREGRYLFKAGQPVQKEIVVRFGDAGAAADAVAFATRTPLVPQAPPEYLCAGGLLSRPVFPKTPGLWDAYEKFFEDGFQASLRDREQHRTWGWMHFGDWFGERILNYGNNEYDMSWAMAAQWARTGDRRYLDRGLEMARHHSTIDTAHGDFSEAMNGLVYEHSFNHVGIDVPRDDPRLKEGLPARYMAEFGAMFGGAIDRQGHVFQGGNWICAALTGDGWLRETAARVCDNQAARLTPAFDFSIERGGGWPLINMAMAHHYSGDPFYLNAARIMIERTLQRQDPASGGWLHWHAGGESGGEQGMGGKAFAVAILTHGVLRYLEQEPRPRPDVERMLVRGADFLREHAWVPGRGFRYISHLKYHADKPRRGASEGMNAELVAFAYEQTKDPKYLELLQDMLAGYFDKPAGGNGKGFTQHVRQTVFGLDRMRAFGVTNAPAAQAAPPDR